MIPLLAFVLYVYAVEIERRNWNLVFAGLALWAMDWFNEIWNGLVLHATGYAPVWGAPADTAFLILTFFAVAFWVHDLPTIRRQATVVGALYAFDATCLVLFAGVLAWI